MTITEKIIKEFEEKFSRLEMGYEELKSFLRSSLHQVATEAIEAVRLELKTDDTKIIPHKDIQGYNTAVFLMEQKAKKFLEENF